MRIRLPNVNVDVKLEDDLSIEEKIQAVNQLLNKEIGLDGIQTTLEDYLRMSWYQGSTKYFLTSLATYLCKKDSRTDKYILSRTQLSKMKHGDARQILFSNLNQQEKEMLGLIEHEDKFDE